MASYEEAMAVTAVVDTLQGFDDAVKSQIEKVLVDSNDGNPVYVQEWGQTVPEGQAVQVITIPDSAATEGMAISGTAKLNAAAILVGKEGPSILANFDENALVQAVVLNGTGDNAVTFKSDKDLSITLGGGDNDIVVAKGVGNDTINYNGGSNVTINAGDGRDEIPDGNDFTDVVTVMGAASDNVNITQGAGNFAVQWNTDKAVVATIDGGDGFDMLQFGDNLGTRADHQFEMVNGKLVMHSEGAITLENMEVITYDDNGDGLLKPDEHITVIADSKNDTIVARLYKVAFGREPIDSTDANATGLDQVAQALDGLDFWMNRFYKDGKTADGYAESDLQHLVYAMLNAPSNEFYTHYGVTRGENVGDVVGLGKGQQAANEAYVDELIGNLGANATDKFGDGTMTRDDFVNALTEGTLNAFDVVQQIVESETAQNILGLGGENYVIQVDNA